ncbi:alpha/beta fold hydrolase [Chitinophaga nivalis]|uniref:Alpha/beta hydrolase n=1 Tax=Chitinophaga nivalis TaxID=2991709 RepID=A0ABT3IH48_9BACT|nr:alpha/beta hydrolase [Chitinophaga nivalis]MCW3467063.1 alpha/beta hydrolase [Chitinophaga nivalis]MCW3483246.1 alpha/beta hydrolase [Chitinophaga nivalis]
MIKYQIAVVYNAEHHKYSGNYGFIRYSRRLIKTIFHLRQQTVTLQVTFLITKLPFMKQFFAMVSPRLLLLLCLFFGIRHMDAAAANHYSFAVKKEGRGTPLIFLPGAYCSGAVWDETVAHYKKNYTCYQITLPGFGGQPPIQSDSLLNTVVHELADFIRENKLQKPVIVGHSLGGWLALQLGIRYPDLPGKLICVSSGPFLPAFFMGAHVTPDSTRAMALEMKKQMSAPTPAHVKSGQQRMLASMITDARNIKKVADMAATADGPTQGTVMYELYTTDLRDLIHLIRCPILVLADWAGYKDYGATRTSVLENYQLQYKQAPQTIIAMNDQAKHFIMLDQPVWFFHQVDSFLRP